MIDTTPHNNHLRPMTVDDVEEVLVLQESGAVLALAEVFPQDRFPFPRTQVAGRWREEVEDPAIACYVIVADNQVAGFAATRGDEFLHFGIGPQHWGSGLATDAHTAVLATIASAGHERTWLHVFAGNRRGRRFYEKLGWRETGERSRSPFPPHPDLIRYERATAPYPADDSERRSLLGALDAQRAHVLRAIDGLSNDDLRRPVLPSGWTILGLVRHLTLGLERFWFHTTVGGQPLDYWPDDISELDSGRPADWRVADDEQPQQVIDDYRAAIASSDHIIRQLPLSAAPLLPPEWAEMPDLRSVIVHVIVDNATHAGHLDAVRELLDGRQNLVL